MTTVTEGEKEEEKVDEGVVNVLAVFLQGPWDTERYKVRDEIYLDILYRLGVGHPEIDAFADDDGMYVLERFWGKGGEAEDAFKQDWRQHFLWINAPFFKMPEVVDKVIEDRAEAIMLVPDWRKQNWLKRLMRFVKNRHYYAEGMRIFDKTWSTRWGV